MRNANNLFSSYQKKPKGKLQTCYQLQQLPKQEWSLLTWSCNSQGRDSDSYSKPTTCQLRRIRKVCLRGEEKERASNILKDSDYICSLRLRDQTKLSIFSHCLRIALVILTSTPELNKNWDVQDLKAHRIMIFIRWIALIHCNAIYSFLQQCCMENLAVGQPLICLVSAWKGKFCF